jgi:hypothetical protein
MLEAKEMAVFGDARNVTGIVQVILDMFGPDTLENLLIVVACFIIRNCQVTRLSQYATAACVARCSIKSCKT